MYIRIPCGHGLTVIVLYCIYDYMECIVGSALYITDQHILYYYMDVYQSFIMGCSYFQSPDQLVVQGWIRAMSLYPTTIHLEYPSLHLNLSWGGWVKYCREYYSSCHRIVAVSDISHHFVIKTFPAP